MNHHISLVTVGRRTLTRDERETRGVVRAVARTCGERLQLFAVVDDHVHLVADVLRPRLLARDVVRAIRCVVRVSRSAVSGIEFQAPHVLPVESRAHHMRLVEYMLRQASKHGLPVHPALWTGSCFLDLAGLRLLPGFDARALQRELPRVKLRSLLPHVGLTVEPILLAEDEELARVGVGRIVELASAVHALDSSLEGKRTRTVVAVRALTTQAAIRVGFPPRLIAPHLEVEVGQIRRLARRELDPRALPALLRRLTLEERITASRRWHPTSQAHSGSRFRDRA